MEKFTDKEALDYHSQGKPGKIEIIASKPMATQRDLALAYSPGVAAPVEAIAKDPSKVYDYTSKGNTVAVISNGSAILGLGNLGALASKPVMEGKAVLFKRFADIDSIDIEVDSQNAEEIINCVAKIGNSFGGINLEDIASPDCFINSGRISGSGFAQAKIIGSFAIDFTIAGVTTFFADKPKKISAPFIASSKVLSFVLTACADLN